LKVRKRETNACYLSNENEKVGAQGFFEKGKFIKVSEVRDEEVLKKLK